MLMTTRSRKGKAILDDRIDILNRNVVEGLPRKAGLQNRRHYPGSSSGQCSFVSVFELSSMALLGQEA
jgi:hypothetical protein